MLKKILVVFLVTFLLNLFACSGTVTDIKDEKSIMYQIAGCQSNGLAKTNIEDSCFTYTFNQSLIIDFCVSANCCPDSNRFELSNNIRNDTIFVAVTDTAAQLCHCICDYKIHFEKYNLPLNSYLFYCSYNDEILYAVRVIRKPYY